MSGIKKLAGQTLWYGLPTIGSRFLGYILNFSLSFIYHAVDTADLTQIYAIVPFLNILFTYGVETSYFRFVQDKDKNKLYNTLNTSILVSSIVFSLILLLLVQQLADATFMSSHPEYFIWLTAIIFLDTLATLPFAKLRQEGRPRKYAFIRVMGIVVNVLVVVFFIGICPQLAKKNPDSSWLIFYNPTIGIGYYLIGNLVGSAVTFLLLWQQWISFRFTFDKALERSDEIRLPTDNSGPGRNDQ